jgi:TolB-like protein
VIDKQGQVLVSEFTATGSDTAIASVATEAFRTDLAQSKVVRLVQRAALRVALQRMRLPESTTITGQVARELATREGVKVVIEGEVRQVGGRYLLSTRLVAPATGEVLDGFRESAADQADIIGAIDRLSKRTRAKIGESLKAVRAGPTLEHVTTSSFAALEKYTQAMRARQRRGGNARAMDLLREAFALDTPRDGVRLRAAWRRRGVDEADSVHIDRFTTRTNPRS